MGEDIRVNELLNMKNEILDNIINGLNSWDGTIETGIELMNANQSNLHSIEKINEELYAIAGEFVDQESYYAKLRLITIELGRVTTELAELRKEIIKGKISLCNKEGLIDSYISNNRESVFIDKDI